MRTLTKLESQLLGITPTETHTINEVMAGGKVHPMCYRRGISSSVELLGPRRRRIVKILDAINIGGSDLEFGNDAPRGGVAGKWIKLSASGRAKAKRRLADDQGDRT